ncbi:MAG TPA: hypothetical protein VNT75_24455 [Symbiobacteriaceae bacterium]|nr:hypothetical protein [Symbiobacteriaceae bacterium]
MQIIVHSTEPEVAEQQARLRSAGLGVYAVGPVVKNIQTCSFCSGEKAEGLPDARALDAAVAGVLTPFPVRVGFSGCTANCSEALLRDIGVVRQDGGTYEIYLGGRTGSLTPSFGVRVAAGVTAANLAPAVGALLQVYQETAKGRERLWKNLSRIGPEPYLEAAAPFACHRT